MKMLGGSYGEGQAFYSAYERQLLVTGKKKLSIPLHEIVAFEELGAASSSRLGKAGVGAAAGFLLAGPLAGLAGLALGGSSGSKQSFTFGLAFSSGESILLNASAKDYGEVKAAISGQLSKKKKKTTESTESKTKATVESSKITSGRGTATIKGRLHKSAPEKPNVNTYEKLSELYDYLTENEAPEVLQHLDKELVEEAIYRIIYTIDKYNDQKWRFFDEFINDYEACECASIALAIHTKGSDNELRYAKAQRDMAQFELDQAKRARGKNYWFNGAKIDAEVAKFEKKAKEYLTAADEYQEKHDTELKSNESLLQAIEVVVREFMKLEVEKTRIDEYIMLADIEDNYGNGSFNIGKKLFLTAHKNCKLYDHSNKIKPSDVVAEATRGESISIEQRLIKLRELRDLEIISEEEYTLQRSKIISEI